MIILFSILGCLFLYCLCGISIIRPTNRGVLETLGKFEKVIQPGIVIIFPGIHTLRLRNITERIADVDPQDIITKDNLNAKVDLQVYYKVKSDDESIKNSYYNIDNFKLQIISLAQTTARNVIGDMKFAEVNNQRDELNNKLYTLLKDQITNWGVQIVRIELKEINPPADVQETMNKVIKAQNEKDAAVDSATAVETLADGKRRASIKEAEGIKQAKILEAQGKAEAIKLVNEAADKYFKGNARELKQLEITESSLKENSKIIITKDGISPQLIIGNLPISS